MVARKYPPWVLEPEWGVDSRLSIGLFMPETSAPVRLRFGVFELDLRAGELRKQGVRLRLQEQPFQVLAMLLERPGETVTREELRNRLWNPDTFVDFDHGVNKDRKSTRLNSSH